MIEIHKDKTYNDRAFEHQRKVRKCLRCKKPFESEWIGERICKRCKNSGVWKQGLTTSVRNTRDWRRTTPSTSER